MICKTIKQEKTTLVKRTIFWIGDSTVQDNDDSTYPQTGMGQGLRLFLENHVKLSNHAKNGRSTKSFLDEGRLALVYDQMKIGDLLLIQFGHNDGKEGDLTRFTSPSEYKENLIKMINAARNRHGKPILITPLCRCWFKNDYCLEKGIHGEYPQAMKEVALEMQVPLIDLYNRSRKVLKSLGRRKSLTLFMTLKANEYDNYPEGLDDQTHLKYNGAMLFGNIVVEELIKLNLGYEEWFKGNLLGKYDEILLKVCEEK